MLIVPVLQCWACEGGNNGTVAGVNNGNDAGRNQSMTYDPVNRISTAETAATSGQDCWGLSYGNDQLGNLTAISPTKCSGPNLSVSVNPSTNHISTVGYSYDAAGDATADGAYTYTYNAENQVTSAGGVDYTYDGNGMRVEKSSGTLYWRSYSGPVLEETDTSGNMQRDYIFFAQRRIAWRDSSGNAFYLLANFCVHHVNQLISRPVALYFKGRHFVTQILFKLILRAEDKLAHA